MKILLIIPSLGMGGSERVISGLANAWVRNEKCFVYLVVLSNMPDFYQIDEKVKIYRLGYESGSKGGYKVLSLLSTLVRLRKLIRSLKPDACMSFIREANILSILASLGLNTKVLISERDSPHAFVSPFYHTLRKNLYPLADSLIVQTKDYENFATLKLGVSNIKVIPNPVRDIRCSINHGGRERIIINVGRLIEEKGQKQLLEAFSLCKYANDWRLVILGDGNLKDDLIRKAVELGVLDRVSFLGKTREVDEWLCRSSIFAFTSISEGFPNALVEAMSASLPCVSFNCVAGPRDLIKDGVNGYLVEINDTVTFAQRLDTLIQSASLRAEIGKRAKSSLNKLNFNSISKDYFDFLKG